MDYGYKRQLEVPFNEAVKRTREALTEEGFGVLTEIDVKNTLKKKLDVDFDSYIILGACNPSFAFEALKAEKEIGLLLPCNVIVYEEKGSVFVSAIIPSVSMGFVENPKLEGIAAEVEEKIKKVVDGL